jgi:hypothetical protein
MGSYLDLWFTGDLPFGRVKSILGLKCIAFQHSNANHFYPDQGRVPHPLYTLELGDFSEEFPIFPVPLALSPQRRTNGNS